VAQKAPAGACSRQSFTLDSGAFYVVRYNQQRSTVGNGVAATIAAMSLRPKAAKTSSPVTPCIGDASLSQSFDSKR
jgi:hypothetical protein